VGPEISLQINGGGPSIFSRPSHPPGAAAAGKNYLSPRFDFRRQDNCPALKLANSGDSVQYPAGFCAF
jgi:hypothetical protein